MKENKKEKMYAYKFLKPILAPIYKFYYNPKIIGKENIPSDGAIILVGNHKHFMDQCNVIISTKRPIHYMAKKEYFDGIFAWFFKIVGCIPVNRSIKDKDAVDSALDVLRNGYALGLFPEGTRNRTEKFLLPFKFGAVSMAKKSNAYLVPFGISGDYKFRSSNLTIKFGKPFKVEGDLKSANERLEREVGKLINLGK